MAAVELIDAELARSVLRALRDQTAATRELRDEVRNLGDKIDRLGGRSPDERATAGDPANAMGSNGR